MASATMRKKSDGSRVFRFRNVVDGVEYQKTWPDKHDEPIPITWSDKRAKTEAQRHLALFVDECKRGAVTKDRRSLSDYAHYVIDYKEATKVLKPRTIDGYRDLLKRIDAAKLGGLRLSDITARDINSFYKELAADGQNERTGGKLSTKTIRNYHILIEAVLTQATKEGILLYNPARNATPPKVEKTEATYFMPEQVSSIIKALEGEPQMWRSLTFLLIGTGMRRGEAAALRWSDIDFTSGRIAVNKNVTRRKGGELVISSPKTGKGRIICAPPEVIRELEAWHHLQNEMLGVINAAGFCFTESNPQKPISPDSITQYYDRFSRRHNLPHIHPHMFRHTQASVLLQSGDIVAAATRLGHSRASTTTDIYGHMMSATDQRAADAVSAVLFQQSR